MTDYEDTVPDGFADYPADDPHTEPPAGPGMPWDFCEVVWEDARSYADWHPLDSSFETPIVYSRGYLIEETPDKLVLAADVVISRDGDDEVGVSNITVIPYGCVRRKTVMEHGAVDED